MQTYVFSRIQLAGYFALILLLGSVACKPADRYFRKVSSGPEQNVVGQIEVSAEEATRGPAYRFQYEAENKPAQITFLFNGKTGQQGPELEAADLRITYEKDGAAVYTFLDTDGAPASALHDGIHRRRVKVTADLLTVTYVDDADQTVKDIHGSSGIQRSITRAEDGTITATQTVLTPEEVKTRNFYGNITGEATNWTAAGLPAEVKFFDKDGKPTVNGDGWARAEFEYDERQAHVGSRLFDAADKPASGTQCGPVVRNKVDAMGYIVERRCLSADGKLRDTHDAITRNTYDIKDDFLEVTIEYLNADEKPTPGKIAKTVFQTDRSLQAVEARHYGADGKLLPLSYMGCIQKSKRDKYGRSLELRHFDENEKPYTIGLLNYSIERNHFDGARFVRREFFDGKEQPVVHGYYNYASMELQVEDDGTEYITFFDAKGKQLEKRKR